MSGTRTSWRAAALGLLAGAILLLAAACSGTASKAASTSRATSGAASTPVPAVKTTTPAARAAAARPLALTVQAALTGRPVPAGFVGLSMEIKALEAYAGANSRALDPAFEQLLRDIAPNQQSVLRIGGDGSDWSWWPVPGMAKPGGVKYDLTPQWMDVARSLAQAVNARLILGVNLEANSRRLAAAEGQAMVTRIGARYVDALELGNEPELYGSFPWYKKPDGVFVNGRPAGYDVQDYIHDFSSIAGVMPAKVPLGGPSSGGPEWLAQLGPILKAEPRVRLATIHAYPLKHCTATNVPTIPLLLSDSSSAGFAQSVASRVNVAHGQGKSVRLDEMNAISCGGTQDVSNAFASALWMVDALFQLEKIGVDGVNVHTVPNTINEVLGPGFSHGKWSVRVHPEYYGMIMFAEAAPPGARLMRLSAKLPSGVRAWATKAPDGHVRVVLINDHPSGSQTVTLHLPGSGGSITIERLRAPSLGAKSGITLGGQSFGSDTSTGVLAGKSTVQTLRPSARGAYDVTLPAASAALLTR